MTRDNRLVVDSNALTSPKVQAFLSRSKRNFIVIPEDVFIESLQPTPISSIEQSVAVIRHYPSQTYFLRSTGDAAARCKKLKRLQHRIIDWKLTADFPKFLSDLEQAKNGSTKHIEQFNSITKRAYEETCKMRKLWSALFQDYDRYQDMFSDHEIRIIRSSQQWPPKLVSKLGHETALLARGIIESRADILSMPSEGEVTTSFAYRISTFQLVHFLFWIGKGSPKISKETVGPNDVVDSIIGTFATYFDGFVTDDRNCLGRYKFSKKLIQGVANIEKSEILAP